MKFLEEQDIACLKAGYSFDGEKEAFVCPVCGESFDAEEIFCVDVTVKQNWASFGK